MLRVSRLLCFGLWVSSIWAESYNEPYRPQYHFSPARNWINDPSLLYHNGTYHLFYQYNPDSVEHENVSWGHSTSQNLTHWEEEPVAILARGFPGNVSQQIFTGSAIADTNNTSGLGKDGKTPLVAIYTSFYEYAQDLPSGKSVRANQQSQSVAYSLDDGKTWTTYDALNPIIQNPPAPYEDQWKEFRDPFVLWHQETQKWVLVTSLANIFKLIIWTSDNLLDWTAVSEFGPLNVVDGVWECPNLFTLPIEGDTEASKWVLVLGLNPGGPPETVGSGTQYFIGDFNGTAFVPETDSVFEVNKTQNWLDWGPDYYAATKWNGLPQDQHVQLGWMSNWQYAEKLPTNPWRGAMAFPRHLSLKKEGEKTILVQQPQENITSLRGDEVIQRSWSSFEEGSQDLGPQGDLLDIQFSFAGYTENSSGSTETGIVIRASPDLKAQTRIGYDFTKKAMFVDRTRSGITGFDDTFRSVYHAPLTRDDEGMIKLRVLVDRSSVEVFGGDGESTLTAQIFPYANATHAQVFSTGGASEDVSIDIWSLSSVWN